MPVLGLLKLCAALYSAILAFEGFGYVSQQRGSEGGMAEVQSCNPTCEEVPIVTRDTKALKDGCCRWLN